MVLQILSILVSNASMSLPGGTLSVNVSWGPIVIIADNGHEIPEAILKQVSDPFFTTSRSKEQGWDWPFLSPSSSASTAESEREAVFAQAGVAQSAA